MMKKILTIAAILAMPLLFAACSGDDNESVDLHDPNLFFEPADTATDAESQLRRDFKEQHGSYLLFNDTIQKRFNGTDLNGDSIYWYELLSIDYTIGQTAYASDHYTYTYLTTMEEKQQAVKFIEDYILTHIGGSLRPYSWFLCRQINYRNGSETGRPYAVAGQRATAISCSTIPRLTTESRRQQFVSRVMAAILGPLLANKSDHFADFFAVSKGSYNLSYSAASMDVARNWSRNRGFIEARLNQFGGYYVTPSEADDLDVFSNYALNYDDAYMEKTFENYPLVLKKWYIFKQVMVELGYTF